MASVQNSIVDFLKENNGKAVVETKEFAATHSFSLAGVNIALHTLLNRGVIKKSVDSIGVKMSTEYILIGDVSNEVGPPTQKRTYIRNNGLNGNLLQRVMNQVATLKATQDQLLDALERIKELEKTI